MARDFDTKHWALEWNDEANMNLVRKYVLGWLEVSVERDAFVLSIAFY
jgi:hypothetical protein